MERTIEAATDERVVVPLTFEEFFATNAEGLYGAMWLVTRHRFEAEEIAQEAFLRTWERWDRVAGLEDPVGYLYRTAWNVLAEPRASRRAGAAPRGDRRRVRRRRVSSRVGRFRTG